MSGRISDDLLDGGGYASATNAPMINLGVSGSNGPLTNPTSWIGNTPYVKEHAIVRLLEFPLAFDYTDEPDKWKTALKELVETRALRWEGFKFGVTTEWGDTKFGHGGEIIQTPVNSTQARSEPVLVTPDYYGGAVSTFWDQYRRLFIMEPETKKPGIAAITNDEIVFLPDFYSFSILVIEADSSGKKVVRATLCYNMAPMDETAIELKYDPNEGKDIPEVEVSFTCIQEANTISVRELAQNILDGNNFTGLSPNIRPSLIEEISADVAAVGGGAAGVLDEAARVAINP